MLDSNLLSTLIGAAAGVASSFFLYRQKSKETKSSQEQFIINEVRKNKDESVEYLKERLKTLKDDTDEMKRQYESQIYTLERENARLRSTLNLYKDKYGEIRKED